jgi:DnaJ-like protein
MAYSRRIAKWHNCGSDASSSGIRAYPLFSACLWVRRLSSSTHWQGSNRRVGFPNSDAAHHPPAKALEHPSRPLLCSGHEMNEISAAIARWLEQNRRTDLTLAAVLSVLALGTGMAVFLLATIIVYAILALLCGALVHSAPWLGPAAVGLTAAIFALYIKGRYDERQLVLDPMGLWIFKDIASVGPRLLREGLRQVRRYGQLGELDVPVCVRALTYLAAQNKAVAWQELVRHCGQVQWPRLREQLSLLDGVLFLGDDADRVTLMDPFRLRLRWMLKQEQPAGTAQQADRPKPEPDPQVLPVNEPEKLSAYEILGLSPSASAIEIKTAYRKRVKECHPDLFAGMDHQAVALAERWTTALNAAYASLNPRHRQ